jgi:hypothetical protein
MATLSVQHKIADCPQWPSAENAKAYATSPELKSAMQNAGVISQPDVAFLEAL